MPIGRALTRTISNLDPFSSKAKTKERRILGMAVSILLPQDQSASSVKASVT